MRCLLLALVACGPTYWRGPVERVGQLDPIEQLGEGARLHVTISSGMPADDRPDRPAWLGAPVGTLDLAVDAHGQLAVPGCEPIAATDRSGGDIAVAITKCAMRYVDEPQVHARIDANPRWEITIVDGGRARQHRLEPALTLMVAVATTMRPELVRYHKVWLAIPGAEPRRIDVMAIARGKQPDIPLRPGDTVRIE